MTSKPEREVDARLADWVDGRLSERERERFVAELRVSPQLRKDLEDYEKTVAAVRAALQAPARPVQIADRVMAAIAAGSASRSAGPRWRNRSFVWSLASAAALLVLALLVNTWAPAPKTDTTAALDALKSESEKRRDSDLGNNKAGDVGAVAQDDRSVREQLEQVALEERAAIPGANPAPAKMPAATPLPPAAAAREPAPAEANDPASVRAAVQQKPAAPAPTVQPSTDPTAPTGETDKPGAGERSAGGGGAQPGDRAAAEQLPLLVVRGSAFTESRLQDRQPAPAGPGTGGPGRQGPGAEAPAGAADQSTALRKAAEATDLSQQLDTFFTRQMTVASGADTGRAAWSAGGLQFTPLPEVATLATGTERKETDAKELGETAKERSRVVAGKDGVASVERGWLVEGSHEDLDLVIRQLSAFARAGGMQLTTGETPEAAVAKYGASEGAVPPPKEKADVERRALPRSRLVLRFSAQPR